MKVKELHREPVFLHIVYALGIVFTKLAFGFSLANLFHHKVNSSQVRRFLEIVITIQLVVGIRI